MISAGCLMGLFPSRVSLARSVGEARRGKACPTVSFLSSQDPHVPQPVVYKFDLTSSKVKRLAILINNFQGVEYNMALASFTGKMMQEAAAKQKQQQIQSQEAA